MTRCIFATSIAEAVLKCGLMTHKGINRGPAKPWDVELRPTSISIQSALLLQQGIWTIVRFRNVHHQTIFHNNIGDWAAIGVFVGRVAYGVVKESRFYTFHTSQKISGHFAVFPYKPAFFR